MALATQYREQGLNMLHEYAHYVEGNGQKSVSVEAGLMDMLDRMQSGSFKVFKEHHDWWEEFRLYHRKDGKVVKEGDDLMCATRYALMMLASRLNGAKHIKTSAANSSIPNRASHERT